MTAYYNENDPYAAQWLRHLIAAGYIAPGEVDDRSIADVTSAELAAFDQCHFFAGIGGWSLALRLAGWPDDQPVWTGSCPCQPFSAAGKGLGEKDPRHLWPEFRRLISECRPATVFGEQVAAAAGRQWLAGVRADLEGLAYAVGAADLCAASAGAPHIRQRLWWVADAGCGIESQSSYAVPMFNERDGAAGPTSAVSGCSSTGARRAMDSGMANTQHAVRRPQCGPVEDERDRQDAGWPQAYGEPGACGAIHWLDCLDGKARRIEPSIQPLAHGVSRGMGLVCAACIQAHPKGKNDENLRALWEVIGAPGWGVEAEVLRSDVHGGGFYKEADDQGSGALSSSEHVPSHDMRALPDDGAVSASASQGSRPDEQRAGEHSDSVCGMPLERAPADACGICGKPSDWLAGAMISGTRVGKLRAYGNAIVPQVAAEFIGAVMEE